MELRDWSLVFFTLLTQMAVGAFLTLQVVQFLSRAPKDDVDAVRSAVRLAVVLASLGVGLGVALLHLSVPLEALRALVNLSSSWLSREIVFGGLFAVFLSALVTMQWRSASISRTTQWMAWLTGIAAVTFLYCQIKIYLLPSQPSWNTVATPAAFVATSVRLGVLGVAVVLVTEGLRPTGSSQNARSHNSYASWATLRGLSLVGLLALLAELLILPLQVAALVRDLSPAAASSLHKLTEDYAGVLGLRFGLLCVAGATLAGVLAIHRTPSGSRLGSTLTYASFCLVLAAEVCGRFLFYATRVRVGI